MPPPTSCRGQRATAMPPAISSGTADFRPPAGRISLVYRLNSLIYANRAFLDGPVPPRWKLLTQAGGLDSLFIDTKVTRQPAKPRTTTRR